jgi:hypothetical protein
MSHPYKIGDLVSVNHQIPRDLPSRQAGQYLTDPLPRLGFVTEKIGTGDLGRIAAIRITFLQPYASSYDGRVVTRITRGRPYKGVTLVSRPEAHNKGGT